MNPTKASLHLLLLRWVIALYATAVTTFSSPALTITWTNSASGSFGAAANWSPNQVPADTDTAVITSNSVTVSLDTTRTVGGIILGDNLNCGSGGPIFNMNGQTLNLAGSFVINTCGQYTLDGGALAGTTTNSVILGSMTWSGGTIAGTLMIGTNATLHIIPGAHAIPSSTLNNYGTIAWMGGNIQGGGCSGGTVINNYGLWDMQSDNAFTDDYGCSGITINNSGTFRKSAGSVTNSSQFVNGATLYNTGTVDTQAGNILLQGGGSFTGGTATNTSGVLQLALGGFNINGTITGTNVQLTGGALVGNNVISGGFTWVNGNWNNSTVTIATNTLMIVASNGPHDFATATINNYGIFSWRAGVLEGGGCGGGTTINNYGLWDSRDDLTFNDAYGCNAVAFYNFGTLRKSAGSATNSTQFLGGISIYNTGVVDVRAGNFSFQGGGTFTGGTATNNGGIIRLDGGSYNINGTVTGTSFEQVTANLNGNNIIRGAYTWIGGNWNNSAVTIATNAVLDITGGVGVDDMATAEITNYGTVAWSSGTIETGGCGGGTDIYNYGLWDVQGDLTMNDAYGCNSTRFNNFGILRKSAGALNANTLFANGIYLNNTGSVQVQAGTLLFQGGGSLTGGSMTNGPGIVQLATSPYNINGTTTSTNVQLVSGRLSGLNVISGSFTWVQGTWDNCTVVIASNAVVNIAGGIGANNMNTMTLTNFGTVNWTSGLIQAGGCGGGTSIFNYGLWDSQGDLTLNDVYGCNGTVFYNFGTLRKSAAGTNATVFAPGVQLQNTGLVDVKTGTMSLQGGATSSGGAITNTGGVLQLAVGNFNINGTVTTANVKMVGGSLFGNNLLVGGFTWVDGSWANSGVAISSNCVVKITGGVDANVFYQAAITNYGTVAWSSGAMLGGGCGGTFVYNYGLWDMQGDLIMNDAGGCVITAFYNYGTLRKSAGSIGGSSQFQNAIQLNNLGIVDVQTGTFSLQGGGNFTGGAITNPAGVVQLDSGFYNFNGTVTATSVRETGGNLAGNNVLSGGFTWVSGNWNNSAVTIATNSVVNIAGATVNDLIQAVVTNFGNVIWTSGTIEAGACGRSQLYNYGLWDMQGDLTINDAGGCNSSGFYNAGTFRKSEGVGNGIVDLGVLFTNVGTISALSGSLNFNNTPDFSAGTLNFGIGGSTNYGQITAAGTVPLGGGVSAILLNGYIPPTNSQYVVLNVGGTNGTFTDYTGLNAGSGIAFIPTPSATNLVLTAMATNSSFVGPTIITQPFSHTVNYGDTVTFQVGVAGSPTLVYQWSRNNVPVAGATNATLTLSNVLFTQAGAYTVSISNSINAVVSLPAQLTVNPVLPSITVEPPASITVPQGSNATISVSVAGEPPPTVQWSFNGNNLTDGGRISGSSTTSLTISNLVPSDAGNYVVVAANAYGSVTSSPTVLHINFPDLAVYSITPPTNAVIGQLAQVTFVITNVGSGIAEGTWYDDVLVSTNASGTNAVVLGTASFTGTINGHDSAVVTQGVILPVSKLGTVFLGVHVNTFSSIAEVSTANNISFTTNATLVQGADLSLTQFTATNAALFGQTISVSFNVTNLGNASASANWNDRIYLSPSSNSLNGATVLANVPGTSPLAAGAGYARSQNVTLPLASNSVPGTFYLFAVADADNVQLESVETNNTLVDAISLALPPLPDLAVIGVGSPSNGVAGQSVTVSWAVTNQTTSVANGPWSESVYLVPASLTLGQFATNMGAYPRLGVFDYTNNLNGNTGIARSQQVALPTASLAGDLRAVVVVDINDDVVELVETNNIALATNDLIVPLALGISIPGSIAENSSPATLAGVISRNGDLTSPLVVSLGSSASNHLTVQGTVTIPAGSTTAPFTATVVDDNLPGTNVLVTLTASAASYSNATAQVTVINTDVPTLALSLSATQILQGVTFTGRVTRGTSDNSQPLAVTITSSAGTQLAFPSTVTIPANSNSVSFTVLAAQNTFIAPPELYVINVAASGYLSSSVGVTVANNNAPVLSLSLDRTNISEADGPYAAIATITRATATDAQVTVILGSTNTGAAKVPAQITIPSLQASVSFNVAAVNDTNITGPKVTLISAQTIDSGGNLVGNVASQTLYVQDANGPTLEVTVANKVVGKGLNPATTAIVTANPPPTNDLVVKLTSSATNEAVAPSSVTILAGHTNATFNINSLDDGFILTSQNVSVTASAAGYASGSVAINVTDIGTSDLTIASINAPASAYSDQPLTIGFRLANQGLGGLSTGVSSGVFLTTDPTSGNNIFVGTVPFPGPLPAGQFVDQTLGVPVSGLPAPGTYYVVVTADINNEEAELNEANNTLISSTPIVIVPEYTATVQAGVTNGLQGALVPLTGSATLALGGPAANRPINILIVVRGLQRVISTTTDSQGNFNTTFNPLPMEGGAYTAAAVAPGVVSAAPQTSFNILGFTLNPPTLALPITEGSMTAPVVILQNTGDVPLTGLTATVNGLAANLSATATFGTNRLAAQGTANLTVSVTANDATVLQSAFVVHITTAEGQAADLPVAVQVNALTPRLAGVTTTVVATMVRGSQTVVNFGVINVGGAATGPVAVSVPNVPWLSVGSMNPTPSIAPGATNQISLILTPAANMALGPYSGTLQLNANGTALQLPFTFTAVSDAHGALMVQSVDEYTYFASGSPPLTNATVTLLNPFTSAIVAQGVTDTNGNFFVPSLMEGVYELDLTSPKHAPFRGEAIVTAGQTNNVTAFLSRQTVTYIWTVVPTTVQDSNNIVITTEFEANVPAPVVVPTPASIDLAPLTQPGQFLDIPLTLVNEGLIAVSNVTLNVPTHPMYRFDVLTTTVGSLAAHGTITIPMRITRVAPPGTSAFNVRPQSGVGPCNVNFGLNYSYPCGPFGVYESVQITVLNVSGNCTPTPVSYSVAVGCNICGAPLGGGYGGVLSGPGGGGGGGVSVPPSISLPPQCDPCYEKELDCLIGFIPVVGCIYGIVKTCAPEIIHTTANPGFPGASQTVEDCGFTVLGCIGGDAGNVAGCLQLAIECLCKSDSIGDCIGKGLGGGGGPHKLGFQPFDGTGGGLNSSDLRDVYLARSYVAVELMALVVGDTNGEWFSPGSGPAFGNYYSTFIAAAQPASPGGAYISLAEAANLMSLPVPDTVSPAEVASSIARWNLTVSNWSIGLLSPTNALPGMSTNFIDAFQYTNLVSQYGDVLQASQAAGFNTPLAGLISALQQSGKQPGATCARIRLEIDQSAVLTRDAFHATLVLNNGGVNTLTNITVNLKFQNALGQDVTSLFGIEPPIVSGDLTGVNGTGMLPAGGTGNAQWTLLPTLDAAPTAPTNYLVSGSFSYQENGSTITVPLSPSPIAVQPSPQLYLDYFLQRDVFADDPFTPEIEPSIPFPLAVLVQNKGYGVAQNFHITSAQPKIIDNEKGLLINFTIIGTQVSGQDQTPSLTADFGDIPAMSTKVADFLFISTLQGLFIDYTATFQHVDPLGNPRLSLIQAVNIHNMTHMVQADGMWDDGLPDFLVDVMPTFESIPDTLFLSDGTQQPVTAVFNDSIDAAAATNHLNVQLTVNCPAGFVYLLVPDPADGKFTLTGVQRANGTNLLTPNFYVTDRTFTGQGQTPIRENKLHLFDYHTNAGPVTYTLVYTAPAVAAQTNAPISSVFSLQPQSPPEFGVAWFGANLVGQAPLAFYDIYSSDNGGAFTNWQSHTTATSAVFDGAPGHTYSFYSVSTDTVGNHEATPGQPQATTLVNATNYAPTISVASQVAVNAGQVFSLGVTAGDSNIFDTLTFTLGPGAPAGVQVDPLTGHLTWQTSLALGGTTNPITVIVTDNGQPPLSSSATVKVVVQATADAPVLAAIPNYIITEGTLLTFTNSATDDSVPARTLTYALGAGAPVNASVNATTGVFQWRPLSTQAPSTNTIAVIVRDNGTPTLSATQQFQVVVRAELNEFVLAIGSTNVLAGNNGSVSVQLASSLDLTNITAILQGPASSSLTNFTLQNASPEVLSTLLQPLGGNEYSLNLTLNPALSPGGNRTLAQLSFAAAPQTHSAIVPLAFSGPAATQSDGTAAPKPGVSPGRVFLIAREPLLDAWLGSHSARMITLYGKPWASYEMDYSTNAGSAWQEFLRIPMTNTYAVLPVTNSLPQVFYRALEFSANPPILELRTLSSSNTVFLVYGQSNNTYMLVTETNLAGTNWTDVAGFTLTNSFQYINGGGATNPAGFFRAKKP